MAEGLTSQLDQILKNTTGAKNREAVPLIVKISLRLPQPSRLQHVKKPLERALKALI